MAHPANDIYQDIADICGGGTVLVRRVRWAVHSPNAS